MAHQAYTSGSDVMSQPLLYSNAWSTEHLTWLPAQASLAAISPSSSSRVTAQVLPLAQSYGEASWWVSWLHSPPVWHHTHTHTQEDTLLLSQGWRT